MFQCDLKFFIFVLGGFYHHHHHDFIIIITHITTIIITFITTTTTQCPHRGRHDCQDYPTYSKAKVCVRGGGVPCDCETRVLDLDNTMQFIIMIDDVL